MSNTRYDELGGSLRSRRERIRPEEVELAPGPRRHIPGLRRDEVAVLTGALVEYYTELERGAGSQPSDQMLAALARAMRLIRDERDHLYRLANHPLPHQGGTASHVHPSMLDLLTRIDGTPGRAERKRIVSPPVGADRPGHADDANRTSRWAVMKRVNGSGI